MMAITSMRLLFLLGTTPYLPPWVCFSSLLLPSIPYFSIYNPYVGMKALVRTITRFFGIRSRSFLLVAQTLTAIKSTPI